MLATAGTGLVEPHVFYFGNAIGEAGNQPGNAIVNATDEILARNFPHGALNPAAVDDPYDYNRDGLVNGTDQIIARTHQTNPLNMLRWIAAPASDAVMAKAAETPDETPADSAIRLDWLYEFAQANAKRAASKSDPAAEAVDKLLASYWQ